MTVYCLDDSGSISATAVSRWVLGSIQAPVQRILQALSPTITLSKSEVYHLPRHTAEVKNAWQIISTPHMRSWRGATAQRQLHLPSPPVAI